MALRFPVVTLGAEYLVMGHLMRRNILTYKAPPMNEGYDLICIHPDPRQVSNQVRVQVKSRYQTDSDRGFPVKEASLDAFDFLVVVFMNLGYFYRKQPTAAGKKPPELYTLPAAFIREHRRSEGWGKVKTRGLDLKPYRDEKGFELIAQALQIPYPSRDVGA